MKNMPIFMMLVGLPGSGKSTHAQQLIENGYIIHSSDAIREELTGDVNNQDLNSKVFETLHKRVKEDLANGNNVIYDATNLNWKRRKAFLQELNKIKCWKVCDVIATPFEVCLVQNDKRDRKVPYDVIDRMYRNFDIPYYNEGWDRINILYSDDKYKTFYGKWSQFIYDTMSYDQDNEHHKLSLGEHSLKCKRYVRDKLSEQLDNYPKHKELTIASAIHDNGKPFTQTYKNKKDEITDKAHYYEHEHVGCYNAMFYDLEFYGNDKIETLDVCALIRWHMILHFYEDWNKNTKEKYEKEFTEHQYLKDIKFYEMLHILYEGDKEAH